MALNNLWSPWDELILVRNNLLTGPMPKIAEDMP